MLRKTQYCKRSQSSMHSHKKEWGACGTYVFPASDRAETFSGFYFIGTDPRDRVIKIRMFGNKDYPNGYLILDYRNL